MPKDAIAGSNETVALSERTAPSRPSVLCLYHGNCMDGLVSAAIVHLFYQGAVECVAVNYGEPLPVELIVGRHVLLVDFTFEPDVILPHLEKMISLTIIDHHKDAMKAWVDINEQCLYPKDILRVVYDNKRSGGGLVWRFFFSAPGNSRSMDMPILIQYAQEYDLRTKALPNTDEVQSGLRYSFPPRHAQLQAFGEFLIKAGGAEVEEMRRLGAIILRQEMLMVEDFLKRHLMVRTFLDYESIPVCHMPAELANQAGELLSRRYPSAPFVVLFEDNYQAGTRKYSFRSKKGMGVDVSAIAMQFGGKGHEDSAGATVKCDLMFA